MKSVEDVIVTLSEHMESRSQNSKPSSSDKVEDAMAAEVLEELVLFTLTIPTRPTWLEASCVRHATRLFERYGITRISLATLLAILRLPRLLENSEGSS